MKPIAPHRTFEQLIEIASRLPWWGTSLTALVVYLFLHPIAVLQMPTPTHTLDAATTAIAQLIVLIARIGQYLLPVAFLFTAAVSAFTCWKRADLRETVALDTSGSILKGLRWTDFELLVGDAFKRQGYEVCSPRSGSSPHQRALELTRDGQRFLIDCTDWRSWKAGATAVRKLHQRLKETNAAGGFAVTSGQFTPEAMHFAAEKDIRLIDGHQLKELVCVERRRAMDNPSGMRKAFRKGLARRISQFATACSTPVDKTAHAGDPDLRLSSQRAQEDGLRLVRDRTDEDPPDTAEIKVGRQLAAMIRAERNNGGKIESATTPSAHRFPANPFHTEWRLPKIRTRKIADVGGTLAAIGLLWGTYQWFAQLPDTPADTPWALLGSDSDSEIMRKPLQGTGRLRSAGDVLEDMRPLGQYQFGPPPSSLTGQQAGSLLEEEKPIETYHSLHELEVAFDAKYVPPPECYAYESNNLLVKCGNHRIRARHAFIASGGKVTPMLLGGWEVPRTVPTEVRPQDWPYSDQGNRQQESTRDWEQGRQPERIQDPPSTWGGEYTPEPNQDQRVMDAPEFAPIQRLPEPADDTHRERRRDLRRDSPGFLPPEPIEQPDPEQRQDWKQDWVQGSVGWSSDEWRRDGERQVTPVPAQDRHQGWPWEDREERNPDWSSQPLPVERRHWVDDR